MKYDKKAKGGGFAIIAFGVIALLLVVRAIGYVLTQSSDGVYQ